MRIFLVIGRTLLLALVMAAQPWLAWAQQAQAAVASPVPAPVRVETVRQPVATDAAANQLAQPSRGGPAAAQPGVPGQAQPLNSLAGFGADYRIGPNDLLDIDVYGVADLKRTVRVNSSGKVSLPLVGAVALAGLTAHDAETRLAASYGEKYLQDPQISVFIREFTTQRITIEGAVNKPGIYPLTGQITLLRAIALAGGGASMADLGDIMVFHNVPGTAPESKVYDLDKIRSGEVADPVVVPDDVIVVKRDGARTALRDSLFRDIIDSINPFSVFRAP